MFSRYRKLGRFYNNLPPTDGIHGAAANVLLLGDYLLDESVRNFGSKQHLASPASWEWRLGTDLKTLGEFGRDFAPVNMGAALEYIARNKG